MNIWTFDSRLKEVIDSILLSGSPLGRAIGKSQEFCDRWGKTKHLKNVAVSGKKSYFCTVVLGLDLFAS